MATEVHDVKPVDGSIVDEADKPEVASSVIYIDPAAEKRLIRKLDWMLSPMMVLTFLVAYLDRSNIGMSPCISST
jgi:hypothetical protein